MNPRSIVVLVIAVLVLGTLGFLWYRNEHPAPFQNAEQAGLATTTASFSDQPQSLNEDATYYVITASYPGATPLPAGGTGAVATMKQFELDTIAQFKKDGNFANLTHDDIQMLGLDERKETLDISYKTFVSPHAVSYLYTVTADTLGAHPNTVYRTFAFDTRTGSPLSLASVFAPSTDYLSLLSSTSRRLLPAVIAKNESVSTKDVDPSMLSAGTSAKADNFENWYLDGTNLVLVFAPYQVAPYAAGTQVLAIPLSSFGDSLSAEYR